MVNQSRRSKTTVDIADSQRQLTHEQQRIIQYAVDKQNEQFRTVIGKMVEDPIQRRQNRDGNVPSAALRERTMRSMNDIQDIRAIQRSLPESETAQDILVSSILSPNDMVSEELTWSIEGNFPGSLGQKLLAVIKKYFTDEFKIDKKLSTYPGNALFNQGSHILAVFPESAIDDIINSRSTISLESHRHVISGTLDKETGRVIGKGSLGKGLLEQKRKKEQAKKHVVGMESFFFSNQPLRHQDSYYSDIIPGVLRITDNEDILKLSLVKQRILKDDVKRKYQHPVVSMESINFHAELKEEEKEVLPISQFYRKPHGQQGNQNIVIVNDKDGTSRRSLGHPMCIDMPHRSCIPVFTPGNAEDHIGYIFVLDESGNPVTYLTEQYNIGDMENNFQQFKSQGGDTSGIVAHTVMKQTLNDLSNLVAGKEGNFNKMSLDTLRDFYTRLIERDITARFNDGIYGKDVVIPRISAVYNIMLARALAGSVTQLLFMPASLVTYIAFYFDDFGIGESLISRSKSLAALRIATLYANSVAVVKNAVGTVQLKINLDPDVTDGEERIAKIVNSYMEANSITPLFSSYDPQKISESLFRSSIELVVEGNDGMDQTTVETEYRTGDRPLIDNDYMENSKKDLINSWHVIPSLYDDSETPQFSSEFITKNALFLKRNYMRAIKFNSLLKDFVEKYVIHDGALIDELSQIIREGYSVLDKELIEEASKANSTLPIIEEFLTCLYPRIPLPELESESQIKNAWSDYKTKVENYLEAMIDESLISHLIKEDDPEKKKEIKASVMGLLKNFFLADWIRKKNAFPEFDELLFVDGKPNKEAVKRIIEESDVVSSMVGDIINEIYERNNPSDEGGDFSSDTTSASGEGDGFSTDDSSSSDESSTEENTEDDTSDDNTDDENKEDGKEEEDKDSKDDESKDDSDNTDNDDQQDNDGDNDSSIDELSKLSDEAAS